MHLSYLKCDQCKNLLMYLYVVVIDKKGDGCGWETSATPGATFIAGIR